MTTPCYYCEEDRNTACLSCIHGGFDPAELESLRTENAKLKEDLANRTRQLSEVTLKMREYEAILRNAGQDWGWT